MPTWHPVPAYSMLCREYKEKHNSRDCSWNVITTVWDARGIKAIAGNGTNNMLIQVSHLGIREDSKVMEKCINEIPNRTFKREYTGQPEDFFASCLMISVYHTTLLGPKFIGEVRLGILDIFLSEGHMLPMQWFPLVDPNSDLPAEPMGFLKLNCIINNIDEPGQVQSRAPDDVADWELNFHDILQIPRLNLRKCASHQYNFKLLVYQGFDLGTGSERTADPVFRVISGCGAISSDPFPNSLRPKWNTMLQLPFYEPSYCDLIICEVWDANVSRLSHIVFSWKDIVIRQEYYKEPRWIDMYERRNDPFRTGIGLFGGQSIDNMMESAGVPRLPGDFEEQSVYCGRVLLAAEIEERSEKKEPSPGVIALKPKDCAIMWSDAMQKMFFRFHCFFGQAFVTSGMQSEIVVEFQVGRKSVFIKPKPLSDNGLFEFFEAVELEYDLPFDNARDNPSDPSGKVWDPELFVERLPDLWIKVYRMSFLQFDKALIGMWKGSIKTALGGGDSEYFKENVYIGMDREDNGTGGKYEGLASIILPPEFPAPEPSKRAPWGKEDDPKTQNILNPYTGYQYVGLKRDAICALSPDDPAGFLGFSVKLWFASREKCANGPPKGPPILSPWASWNIHPIPAPWSEYLNWYRHFNVKAHIYQAKELVAKNDIGIANSFVEVKYLLNPPKKTHTAYLTNNPTFDTTLLLDDLRLFVLPQNVDWGAEEYCVDPEDYVEVEKNKAMLKLSPKIELSVLEENGEQASLLGRVFISPSDLFGRKSNPVYIPLSRGNPDVVEGHILTSFQIIEVNEMLMKEPPRPLVPDKSPVDPEDAETWTSKAPVRPVPMIDCKIQIQVLGLRDLTSPYPFHPIFAPQVEICCDDPSTAQTTKSTSRPSGTNANFMECVEINVGLPEEKRYAPYLDFYIYDHSTLGLPFQIPWNEKPPIVAYGSIPTEDFYPSDEGEEVSDDDDDEDEDEEAKEKKRQKERRKKFFEMLQSLKKEGVISAKQSKNLEALFAKRDEAVVRAFDQYIDARDEDKFVERVTSFLDAGNKVKQSKPKPEAAASKQKVTESEEKVEEEGDQEGKPALEDEVKDVSEEPPQGAMPLELADAPDDADDEMGDPNMEEMDEPEPVQEGEGIEGEDDELPDRQEKVDTPDGKPNAEWMLFRMHPLYDCPIEDATVEKYGKKGAWKNRLTEIFDELPLYRGPIKNVKLAKYEIVGFLKCKVKLFKLEDQAQAEARGEEPRYLDMVELKNGREVPYEVPDVNENYPATDLEIRVYLLKAFQVSPSTVVDGVAKSDNFIEVTLGDEKWKWRDFYDPITALNPQFFRCAKIPGKLPGPSLLHIRLMEEANLGLLQPVLGNLVGGDRVIGETIVDLEDRWFCEEWAKKTVNKPRETRDLYNQNRPGITVGKMLVIVDAVLRVDVDDYPEKDINIAGRQMPLEMRMIVWNLKSCAPKNGYTSDVIIRAEMMGWGRVKETDTDYGVKVSRNAMFNYRIKFKGLKFPCPDPTVPAKDFILKLTVWHDSLLGGQHAIAEGLLPLQPLFLDCMQRNLGKTSADDMEIVSLQPESSRHMGVDEEGTKYPFRWFRLCHPGGPGCKTNKDFRAPGYDFKRNYQCEIQLTIQIMPRAKARAIPASLGFKAGPAKLQDPNRPPQPTNPILDPEGCKAYIIYVCKFRSRCSFP
uniref:C2 domain-containing protein n=1 Tax=Guillardia theta TaxID=55529 RepID=A0A7S4U7T2_GUITH|mmetsp:Transcript_50391/g.157382  ORF Transcript_50391/g.157382 Transcript_50391/m.157382 type:complete len:1668 (+) Transcript_50391:142-5145(+)